MRETEQGKNMQWLKNLNTFWKIVLGIAVLVLMLGIYDLFTGQIRDFKNWVFDRNMAKIEKQNEELFAENERLRVEAKIAAENAEKLELEIKAKDTILENLNAKSKAELDKLEKALEQQDKIEAETNQPTDPYTRCLRVKEKMIALGSAAAKDIVCEGR